VFAVVGEVNLNFDQSTSKVVTLNQEFEEEDQAVEFQVEPAE
jgi:hypothetical protein